MFPILLTFRMIIFLLLLPLILFWRMRRRRPMSHLTALLLKEIIMGIWHRVLGPKPVQIAKSRGRKRGCSN